MNTVNAWSRLAVVALAVLGGGATARSLPAAEIAAGQVALLTGVLASIGAQIRTASRRFVSRYPSTGSFVRSLHLSIDSQGCPP